MATITRTCSSSMRTAGPASATCRIPPAILPCARRYSLLLTTTILVAALASGPMVPRLCGGDDPVVQHSTTFAGDENPLSEGGKWSNNGLDWTKIRKAQGLAFGTQTGTNKGIYRYDDSYAHLSGFPPNQEAWGKVHIAKPDSSCHQEVEILLRWTSSAHRTTGYECFARCVNDGSSYVQIVRWEGPLGKFTYLADKRGANYGLKDGDILKASIVGNVITVSINGVVKAQVKDDTHKTGNPGIGTFLSCDNGRGVGTNGDFGFRSFTARGLGTRNTD